MWPNEVFHYKSKEDKFYNNAIIIFKFVIKLWHNKIRTQKELTHKYMQKITVIRDAKGQNFKKAYYIYCPELWEWIECLIALW